MIDPRCRYKARLTPNQIYSKMRDFHYRAKSPIAWRTGKNYPAKPGLVITSGQLPPSNPHMPGTIAKSISIRIEAPATVIN
jgi:hypothetical protein